MKTIHVPKTLEARRVYDLKITDEPVVVSSVTEVTDLQEHSPAEAKSDVKSDKKDRIRQVVCTYHDGQRIHGKGLGSHPPIVLSASDQDEVVWSGSVPFMISFARISGVGLLPTPFYRDSWNASEGRDGMFRVASGPLRKIAKADGQSEYKFTVTRQIAEDGPADPQSEPLDPHLIVEP